jgi:hypothetical protein
MQLFSADSTIILKDFKNSFAPETMENPISKVGHDWPIFFFQYYQPAQNQDKS